MAAQTALSAPRRVAALKSLASSRDWPRALALLEAFKGEGEGAERDPATLLLLHNAALGACSRASQGDAALGLLKSLRSQALRPDNVTFNSTITAVGRSSDWPRSLTLLEEMREQQLTPCAVTYGALADTCDKASQWALALLVWEELHASGVEGNAMVLSSVVNAAGKAEKWELAVNVLSEAAGRGVVPDGISFNCGINACRRAAEWSTAVSLLCEMRQRSMVVDAMTYQAAMRACGAGRQWQLAAHLQEQLLLEQQQQQQQQQQRHPHNIQRTKPLRGRRWAFDPVRAEAKSSSFSDPSSSSTNSPNSSSSNRNSTNNSSDNTNTTNNSNNTDKSNTLSSTPGPLDPPFDPLPVKASPRGGQSQEAALASQSRGSGHVPVLCAPVIEALLDNGAGGRDGLYVDCTFGRGGHARELLRHLAPSSSKLLAFDMDPTAIAEAKRLASEDPRLVPLHMPFGDLATLTLPSSHNGKLSGLLADLGVSSPQLDQKQRGFSVMEDGPLDLRMNPTAGVSAADWLAAVSAEELTRVIRSYGEDGDPILAARIAQAIVARVKEDPPLRRTQQLAEVVARVKRDNSANLFQQPARLTFQAIRSHLNSEFQQLDVVLDAAMEKLEYGGRFVIICFKRAEVEAVRRFVRLHEEPPGGILKSWPRDRLLELFPLLKRDAEAGSGDLSSHRDSSCVDFELGKGKGNEDSGSRPLPSSLPSSASTCASSSSSSPPRRGAMQVRQPWHVLEVCPPLRASPEETRANTRSRSARALVLEKRRRDLTTGS